MPVHSKQNSENQKNSYSHIYRYVKREEIFIEDNDYQTFTDFLKEYFSDSNSLARKKTFTIRGKTYRGVPYLTQNFFGQLDLIAYKLEPNRFDLIIKENVTGALEKFIRAISTRYVLYFNKKHSRSGSLFINPYNIEKIADVQNLSQVINDLHTNFSKKDGAADHIYSSYPEYLGQRVTQWITFPKILPRPPDNQQSTHHDIKAISNTTKSNAPAKPTPRIPEIIFSILLLSFLSSLGLNNIKKSIFEKSGLISPLPASSPQVSGAKDEKQGSLEPTVSPINQDIRNTVDENQVDSKFVVIRTYSEEGIINLYKSPSLYSEVIAQAKDGEEYRLISIHPDWYKIILNDESYAFLQSNFSEIVRKDNQ